MYTHFILILPAGWSSLAAEEQAQEDAKQKETTVEGELCIFKMMDVAWKMTDRALNMMGFALQMMNLRPLGLKVELAAREAESAAAKHQHTRTNIRQRDTHTWDHAKNKPGNKADGSKGGGLTVQVALDR